MTDEQRKSLVLGYLRNMNIAISNMSNPVLRKLCDQVITDKRFILSPAAREKHQAFPGGLIVHTGEVLEAALALSTISFAKLDKDVIITAVVWHDFGKIYDYEEVVDLQAVGFKYKYTDHQRSIRHLSRSYAEFYRASLEHGLDEATRDKISHCILAHHGRKEWGSPVEPCSPEAFAVHFADMMSSRCSETK